MIKKYTDEFLLEQLRNTNFVINKVNRDLKLKYGVGVEWGRLRGIRDGCDGAPPEDLRRKTVSDKDLLEAFRLSGHNYRKTGKVVGINPGNVERRVKKLMANPAVLDETSEDIDTDPVAPPLGFKLSEVRRYKTFVISSVLNNSKYHEGFYAAIKSYCRHNRAMLMLQPLKYRNPNARLKGEDAAVEWPQELAEHYLPEKLQINKNLYVLGDLRVQATSLNPISALSARVPDSASSVVGHPIIQLRMRAAPKDVYPRLICTTGSLSLRNFTLASSAYLALKFHSIAALVVEVDGDKFFLRHIYANDDGSFYDLSTLYRPDGRVVKNQPVEALVCGDIHARFLDDGVARCTFDGPDSLVATLRPRNIVVHDFLDSNSISHHHEGQRFTQYEKYLEGAGRVGEELKQALDLHNRLFGRLKCNILYVPSNHNDHLYKWLNSGTPGIENLRAFYELSIGVLDCIEGHTGLKDQPFFMYLKSRVVNPDRTIFLSRNSEHLIAGVDVSQHGDYGPNGIRGSLQSFARVDRKMIVAHSHTPAIERSVVQVGTSCKLDLPYNAGLSSWMQAHAVIYPNGATSLLFIVKSEWRPAKEKD